MASVHTFERFLFDPCCQEPQIINTMQYMYSGERHVKTTFFTLFAGQCTDHVNNYTCTCDLGFEGRNCDTDIDFCKSSPCVHGKALFIKKY